MKTGLKKSQKTTIIEFDEQGPRITVSTHNTDLKNRLGAYDTSSFTEMQAEPGKPP